MIISQCFRQWVYQYINPLFQNFELVTVRKETQSIVLETSLKCQITDGKMPGIWYCNWCFSDWILVVKNWDLCNKKKKKTCQFHCNVIHGMLHLVSNRSDIFINGITTMKSTTSPLYICGSWSHFKRKTNQQAYLKSLCNLTSVSFFILFSYVCKFNCISRNLREARDMAISEKERALISERETNAKYEQMLQEYVHFIHTVYIIMMRFFFVFFLWYFCLCNLILFQLNKKTVWIVTVLKFIVCLTVCIINLFQADMWCLCCLSCLWYGNISKLHLGFQR